MEKVTHPILTTGEMVSINGYAYMVCVGLKPGAAVGEFPVYNVHLKSVKYDPNTHKSDYYEKNINLPNFEKL